MCEFDIRLSSVEEVKSFVQVATVANLFEVYVTTPRQTVSAKSFMGMFSLDFRYPLRVMANCTQEELRHFLQDAAPFLAREYEALEGLSQSRGFEVAPLAAWGAIAAGR
ncbi:MAG: hypothetical protein ACLU9S_17930 [Oscillospiraceae bacterium]